MAEKEGAKSAPSPKIDQRANEHGSILHRRSTFAEQSGLPRLPIPSLEETMERFPVAVEALETEEEQEETKRLSKEFLDGDGKILQDMLVKYEEEGSKNGTVGSYVEEFWSEAYLAPDSSVVLNLNPFFLLEDGPDAKLAKDQIGRSASLVFAALKLASTLKREELTPDYFRGKPLCMDQFKALFGSSRIPRSGTRDCVEVDPESTHVAVMSKNQLYYFQALWPDGAVAVDESDIKNILQAIKDDGKEIDEATSIKEALGVLTTLSRTSWATARESLTSNSERNKLYLDIIDSALFVLVLDDFVASNIHEAASNVLHGTYNLEKDKKGSLGHIQAGTCCNRWYDKLQIIVCADGSVGINFEHSAIDGHTALRFASDVFAETVVSFAQSITKLVYGLHGLPHVINAEVKRAAIIDGRNGEHKIDINPKRLTFDIPHSVLDQIFFAEAALGDEIFSSDTYVLEFKMYGKKFITTNKLSPDSFVQMSVLLAYYRLYGEIVCAYEPVLTKQFYHGRTEAMRSATKKAAEFCRVWIDPKCSKEKKLQALRDATKLHSKLVKEAAGGKGVDRHLYALKCIAEKNNLPVSPFFKSEAWRKLNHTVLSTSNCGNPALRLFGFGPVVPDGFGVGYIIKDSGLQYSISSKHRQTERFGKCLHQTLLEFGDMLKLDTLVEVKNSTPAAESKANEDLVSNKQFVSAYSSLYGEDSNTETKKKGTESAFSKFKKKGKFLARVIPRQNSANIGIGLNLRTPSTGNSQRH